MPLSAGTKLGPYEIVAPIGAGGMGEVYRAKDTRLDRIVAVKVSRENFSERVEREARAVAALNHPHICQLYDVGPNYLVMEYIEGEPLKGPLPLEKAIDYAGQILEALDHAHRKGITHRDLKPANILVTMQGIKLLDFGLAKLRPSPLKETDETRTQALSKPLTKDGQILGTLQYMSPEQLQGKEADARSDLFSFGCVLSEMLTGRRAFDGQSAASVIAAILERPAPSVADVAPPALDRVLKRCLEKDPDKRFQSALDLKTALEWATLSAGETTTLTARSRSRLGFAGWIAAGALALTTAIALWSPWRVTAPAPQSAVRLDLDLGAPVSASNVGTDTILSPDGTRLVFVSQATDRKSRLFTRRLDQAKPIELPGTENAYGPFFSPDGQWVGFFADGKLRKIRLDGGESVILCDAPAGRGATWSEDGNIIAALEPVRGLALIPAAGGQPISLTELETGEAGHRTPQVLPGGKAVLFTFSNFNGNYEEAGIGVVSLQDHRRKTILDRAGMNPMYLPSGHLAYVTKGSLFAAPFDPNRLELRGPPKLVIEDVANDGTYGTAQVSFSQTGSVVYRAGRNERLVDVLWLTGDGHTQPLWPEPAVAQEPRVSPEGRRLAMLITDGPSADLWVYDVDKGVKTRLTSGLVGRDPTWTRDGQYLVFQAPGGMFWTRSDGAGKPQPLVASKNYTQPGSFSPDGRLVYSELLPGGGGAIKTVPVENASGQLRAGQPEIFLQSTATSNVYPRFSRDGRWVAYNDAESGPYQVYVRAFPDRGAKWQISNSGGGFPVWSPNGHELFYRSPDNRIMVVNYSIRGTEFSADKPRLWSERQLADLGVIQTFDLAPDGKRFAVVMRLGGDQPRPNQSHVTLLLNFFDELRRKVPLNSK